MFAGLVLIFAGRLAIVCGGHQMRPVAAEVQILAFLKALENYHAAVGAFPTEQQGLRALRTDPGVPGWNGPYLPRDLPLDPWGMAYRYRLVDGRPQIVAPRTGIRRAATVID
jgi:general secretion pathway protein G